MPQVCCVPNCKSNHRSQKKTVSVFSFPRDNELSLKWICVIKRANFTPGVHSRVCELHFKKEDILRSTKFYSAAGDEYDVALLNPRLKPGAVPSKFPGCPKYSTKEESSRESPNSKRIRLENSALLQAVEASIVSAKIYNQEQSLLCLNDVWEKFRTKKIGSWTVSRTENNICFVYILEKPQPEVECLGSIGEDMNFSLFHKTAEIKKIQNLVLPVKIQDCNSLENILLQIEKEPTIHQSVKDKIDSVTDILESLKSEVPEKSASISFFKEQIQLIQYHNNKNAIRYSYETLLYCSLFLAISPHAYKFSRNYNILTLPSTNIVQKICNNSLTDPRYEQTEDGVLKYIKLKMPLLNENDKIVNLQIDEVYLKHYMDYKGGNLVGGAHTSALLASSACTFLINSYFSTYIDVHVAPVKALKADDLHKFQKKIICGLERMGFEVLSTTSDNHSVNRGVISAFANPATLTNEYRHPSDINNSLFYACDPVHLLKNIRNNWLGRPDNEFKYSDFDDFNVIRTASFNTIRELHRKEEGQLLKYGYLISKKAFYPTSLERQNVKLPLQVFNRLTVVAVKEFGPRVQLEMYEDTAKFIEIIVTWWDIANVKTIWKGTRLKNIYQEPFKKVPLTSLSSLTSFYHG